MKTYRTWSRGGQCESHGLSRDDAEKELTAAGYVYSGIDSCDGGSEYWVKPHQIDDAEDVIGDGSNPPAVIVDEDDDE